MLGCWEGGGGVIQVQRYDIRKANEHAAARRIAQPMGYRSLGQLVRAYCPRWSRRHK